MINKLKASCIGIYIISIVLLFSSCKNYFGDINTDPDNPTAITADVLLPQIQVRLAYNLYSDGSKFSALKVKQISNGRSCFALSYSNPINSNIYWNNYYSGVLQDNRQLQKMSRELGHNHYLGISLAIEAYTWMVMTDVWGDIPSSEALQGILNMSPVYDKQEYIYQLIFSLIDEAKEYLKLDDGGNSPQTDDFIYGGDIVSWQGFVNMVEARAYLHLTKMDANSYQKAITALGSGLTSDASVTFGAGKNEEAPWYQYIAQRADFYVDQDFEELLDTTNDPRYPIFCADLQSLPHPYFTPDRSVQLLSLTEQYFLISECLFQTNQVSAAHTAFKNGIESSIVNDVSLTQADYNNYLQTIDPGSSKLTLEDIITQKYIALFCNPETFTDWRRTGLPKVYGSCTGNPCNPPGLSIQRRMPYSKIEMDLNPNTPSPADITIFTPVWWDQ